MKRFVKKRIIQRLLHYGPEIRKSMQTSFEEPIIEHSSVSFELSKPRFLDSTHKNYYANWAFFLYAHDKISVEDLESFSLSDTDKTTVKTAIADLDDFVKYQNLMDQLLILLRGFEYVQVYQHKATSISSITRQSKYVEKEMEYMKQLVGEYENIVSQLEDYPEWKSKVEKECRPYLQWFYIFNHESGEKIDFADNFNKHNNFL